MAEASLSTRRAFLSSASLSALALTAVGVATGSAGPAAAGLPIEAKARAYWRAVAAREAAEAQLSAGEHLTPLEARTTPTLRAYDDLLDEETDAARALSDELRRYAA